MRIRRLCFPTAVLAACLALLINEDALAAGIEVTITPSQFNAVGTGSADYALFLNGSPLAAGPQTVSLGLGDVLRAETSASASTEVGTASFDRQVRFDILLEDGFDTAVLQTTLDAAGNASPETAQGFGGSTIDCFFTSTGCSAPGLPGSISFNSAVESSTLSISSNKIIVNNVTTETGRVGGEESLTDLVTTLELDRSGGDPTATATVRAVARAIFQAEVTGSASLELTVTELTAGVVPVPAAAWLFASALGALGWLRRRSV